MSDLRICVTGGYPIPQGNFQSEALVYTDGGRVVTRFISAGRGRDVRALVCAKAEAWIAADTDTRASLLAAEKNRRRHGGYYKKYREAWAAVGVTW